MKTPLKRIGANLLALCCAALMITPVLSANAADKTGDKLRLDHGHTDIFNVSFTAGDLELELKEDVTGLHQKHRPEDVTLVVKKAAYNAKWAEIKEVGAPGYYLPATQDAKLLWPGWDTLEVQDHGFQAIDINFTEINGPGRVWLLGRGQFGGFKPLLKGNAYQLETGAVRAQSFPAHTHADWVFEKPGRYTMKVNATGTKGGKQYTSNTATYTWVVEGAKPAPEAEATVESEAAVETEATAEAESTVEAEATVEPESTVETEATVEAEATVETPAPEAEATGETDGANALDTGNAQGETTQHHAPAQQSEKPQAPAQPAQSCFAKERTATKQMLLPKLKDDRHTPARMLNPASVVFQIGDAGKTRTTQPVASIPADQTVWMISATQVVGVPWLGANTMTPSVLKETTGAVTWTLKSFSGPGQMEVFTSGNFGRIVGNHWFSSKGGSVTIARNTHVHPNWVFSAPGTYRVGITQSARTAGGKLISGHTTLVFHVGTGSGITSGHFDLGSEVATQEVKTVTWEDANGKPCVPSEIDQKRAGIAYSGQGGKLVSYNAARGKNGVALAHTGAGSTGALMMLGATLMALGLCASAVAVKRRQTAL